MSAYKIPNSFLDSFTRTDLPRQKHYFYIFIGIFARNLTL